MQNQPFQLQIFQVFKRTELKIMRRITLKQIKAFLKIADTEIRASLPKQKAIQSAIDKRKKDADLSDKQIESVKLKMHNKDEKFLKRMFKIYDQFENCINGVKFSSSLLHDVSKKIKQTEHNIKSLLEFLNEFLSSEGLNEEKKIKTTQYIDSLMKYHIALIKHMEYLRQFTERKVLPVNYHSIIIKEQEELPEVYEYNDIDHYSIIQDEIKSAANENKTEGAESKYDEVFDHIEDIENAKVIPNTQPGLKTKISGIMLFSEHDRDLKLFNEVYDNMLKSMKISIEELKPLPKDFETQQQEDLLIQELSKFYNKINSSDITSRIQLINDKNLVLNLSIKVSGIGSDALLELNKIKKQIEKLEGFRIGDVTFSSKKRIYDLYVEVNVRHLIKQFLDKYLLTIDPSPGSDNKVDNNSKCVIVKFDDKVKKYLSQYEKEISDSIGRYFIDFLSNEFTNLGLQKLIVSQAMTKYALPNSATEDQKDKSSKRLYNLLLGSNSEEKILKKFAQYITNNILKEHFKVTKTDPAKAEYLTNVNKFKDICDGFNSPSSFFHYHLSKDKLNRVVTIIISEDKLNIEKDGYKDTVNLFKAIMAGAAFKQSESTVLHFTGNLTYDEPDHILAASRFLQLFKKELIALNNFAS